MKAAKEIECGGVIINDTPYYKTRNMPYGGMKKSGFGREGGKYTNKGNDGRENYHFECVE